MVTLTAPKWSNWPVILLVILVFWISSSLLLDLVAMPSLYVSGLLTQSDFASAGYLLFSTFNRIELLCAASVVTGILVLHNTQHYSKRISSLLLALILFGITLLSTYGLTPYMSALSLDLNLFEPVAAAPSAMQPLHLSYWALEILKLGAAVVLIKRCFSYARA